MRKLLVLLVIAVSYAVLGAVPTAPNRLDASGKRTGPWVVWLDLTWQQTTLRDSMCYYRVVTYKDGKPSGMVRTYTKLGQKRFEGYLLSDNPIVYGDGPAVFYDDFGIMTSKGNYLHGKKTGVWDEWFEDGEHARGAYANGLAQGHWDFWDKAGTRIAFGDYKDGERDGTWHEVDPDKSSRDGAYRGGKHEGHWTFYHPNGSKDCEGAYVDDKLDGVWTFWDEQGKLLGEVRYRMGERLES